MSSKKNPEQQWNESIKARKAMREAISNVGSDKSNADLEKVSVRKEIIDEKVRLLIQRKWASDAVDIALSELKKFSLTVACPGAGKTMFMGALFYAIAYCKERARVGRNRLPLGIFVVPTDSLKNQLAQSLRFWFGFNCYTGANSGSKGAPGSNFDACVMTYAQFMLISPTICGWSSHRDLVLFFDEYHHCGDDKSWGDAVKAVGNVASFVYAVTGTPINLSGMPFAEYKDGVVVSDYTLTYGQALSEQFCRPIVFEWISADVSLSNGKSISWKDIAQGDPREAEWVRRGLDHNLDTAQRFLERILEELGKTFERYRANYQFHQMIPAACTHCMPGFTGKESDSRYMNRIHQLSEGMGFVAEKVAANIPGSSGIISRFSSKNSRGNLLNSINKISEGIDIPRLMVGGWMTNTFTFVWFMQLVGRYIRMQDELPYNQESRLFLPDVPTLRAFAKVVEDEVIGFKAERDEKMKGGGGGGDKGIEAEIITTISSLPSDSGRTISGSEFDTGSDRTKALEAISSLEHVPVNMRQAKQMLESLESAGFSVVQAAPIKVAPARISYEEEIKLLSSEIERLALHVAKTQPMYKHVSPKTGQVTPKEVWGYLNKVQKIPRVRDGKKVNGMKFLIETRGIEGLNQRLALLNRIIEKSGVTK